MFNCLKYLGFVEIEEAIRSLRREQQCIGFLLLIGVDPIEKKVNPRGEGKEVKPADQGIKARSLDHRDD